MMMQAIWLNYEFEVYECFMESPADCPDLPAMPGVYVLARLATENPQGLAWRPIYVGEAEDLVARLSTHEKWSAALSLGMAHIHFLP